MELPIPQLSDLEMKSVVEALIYVAEEPLTEATLVELFGKENREQIQRVLAQLANEYQAPDRGIEIREVANGFRMGTKPEHHEWVRKFVKSQTPAVKLSLAALETLAVIAYKQPITLPEIQDIRGVNATGVIKTLIDRKLVNTAGRKNVIGRPILYRTTKEFLLHFGLKNLGELPSLEEFEELAKSDLGGTILETTTAEGVSLQGVLPLQLASSEISEAIPGEPPGTPAERMGITETAAASENWLEPEEGSVMPRQEEQIEPDASLDPAAPAEEFIQNIPISMDSGLSQIKGAAAPDSPAAPMPYTQQGGSQNPEPGAECPVDSLAEGQGLEKSVE